MTTGTQGWHADPALLSSYLAGDLDAVTGASVEQHVSRCETCRATVGRLLEPQLLEQHVDRHPRRRRAPDSALPDAARPAAAGSRSRRRCCSPSAASLRGAWLVGAFLSLSFATLAAYASGGTALAPFLLAAPLAPVLGVAAAYGPRQDPLEALVATAPYGRTRLILLRTIGVLVSVLPVTVLLGLAVPGPPWLAAAWLGPALALVPVLLALAAFVGPRTAATVVSLVLVRRRARLDAWLLAPTWPVEAAQQGVYLGLAVAACAVIAIRAGTDRQPGVAL